MEDGKILKGARPDSKILGIESDGLGPVSAVLKAKDLIDPKIPVIVNYCDFSCYWNWRHFKSFVEKNKCAGAIPAYHGFHPHSLSGNHYAYMRESEGLVLDIQEKQPFTDDPMEEWASSGTYYFSSGALMLKEFHAAMEKGWSTGGEYYASLAYRHLLAWPLPIRIYPLQHFMQWGTPADLEEYRSWSDVFKRLAAPSPSPTTPLRRCRNYSHGGVWKTLLRRRLHHAQTARPRVGEAHGDPSPRRLSPSPAGGSLSSGRICPGLKK